MTQPSCSLYSKIFEHSIWFEHDSWDRLGDNPDSRIQVLDEENNT